MQVNSDDLTILLTLRGRHLHTLRWLWFANRICFPFRIMIADGEVHPIVAELLANAAIFPNLKYEYHRYNDKSFKDFYEKCSDSASKVKTKYLMLSDNDDFPISIGIHASLDYLNNNSEFVAAGGKIPEFKVERRREMSGEVIGKMKNLKFGYTYLCHDLTFSVRERVLDVSLSSQVLHYHIFRTPALRTIFQEVAIHDFSDLMAHEYYIALRTATLGKVRTDPSVICYFRQKGTSSNFSFTKDWVHHLLHSRLPQDFRTMAKVISSEVTGNNDKLGNALGEDILDAYAARLRHFLGHTMMRYRFPRAFQAKQKLLWLKNIQVVPAWFQQWWSRKIFWREVFMDSRDKALMESYRLEFSHIEAALRGDEFLTFVREYAPELLVND
jgi:glycosyltransferase domain-containing protein